MPVQLQPPNWSIPEQQLRAAFSDKTKLILVNTPHNPTGKVRRREEMDFRDCMCGWRKAAVKMVCC